MTDEHNDGGVEDLSVLDGTWYADRFRVGHNAFEFKIDCGHENAGDQMRTVYFRVVANPLDARELFRLLGVAILRYSDAFGLIDADTAPEHDR